MIDLPKPQPGHQEKPKFDKGQRLKCKIPGLDKAKEAKAIIQKTSSKCLNTFNYKLCCLFIRSKETTILKRIPTIPAPPIL